MLSWPKENTADSKSDECYLFQGNIDDHVSIDFPANARVVAIPDVKILNRHNIWGLEKSGYLNTAWTTAFALSFVLFFAVALILVKALFTVG